MERTIVLNTLAMCVPITPEPNEGYNSTLQACNDVFVIVFNLECIFKLYAMRGAYFKLRWNCFDFVCVLVADVGVVFFVTFFISKVSGSFFSFVK